MMAKLKNNLLLVSLFGLLGVCVGQFVQLGQCDINYDLETNFNIEEFSGQWYEISRSGNPNLDGDCASFTFTNTETTTTVTHNAVNNNFAKDTQGTVTANADTAQLTLSISAFDGPINFWVLRTDYANYAVAFSCENISVQQRRVSIWVLGRQTSFGNEMIPALINTLLNTNFGISYSDLQGIDHSDNACYVLPVIETGQPIILPGQCDANIAVVQNFDVAAFTGTWHEIASYFSPNALGTCARAQYTLAGGVVNVVNSQVVDQTLETMSGTATVASTDNSARLRVLLNVAPGVVAESDLYILATDYNNYAVSYTCVNLPNNQKQVFSWIVSRTSTITATSQAAVDQVVQSYIDLNYQYFQQTEQSAAACFFYPDPVINQPVVFRGQCDSTISAMPAFDAGRYMGLWHNIELYPQAFQDGTCSNARYTLVDGRVEVLNTQVVNQRLDQVEAFAVLVSDDGSAKLEVTFPIAGTDLTVTTDYWVLDTDYDSYALVYSCSNLNDDEMQVTSWKLSRTKTLSAAANAAINVVMNTIQVLDQRYFEVNDQSVEGCFYFPEARPGVPVVFPGQCDDSITAQANFNFQQFQGTWYEIQAYPKDNSGQCTNHEYSFVNNAQLNLVSSSIVDQFISLSNGVVTFSSNDNSGRLTITLTTGSETIVMPFWVLATDYTDYALAYACVNYDTDFRGIWSWKLSRSQLLSTAANVAINNAITNIEVLDNVYYENIDHTDEACFFLPELEAGEPVVLYGQCDTSITGIPNFDITRYAGRWRVVESYTDDLQIGTCNYADYTFATTTSLVAVHSQVVNRELISVSGTATILSTDGTGRLLLNFPSSGDNIDFTILDTDYDSFALGYSCTNIDNNQRRVWSWKLSRENTLSPTANERINNVISNIEVLNNRYFHPVNRAQDGCFYFPEANDRTPVRFPGQCDQDIPVVSNFDAARYLGLWHDIESYPMPFQDGSCPNAFYSLNNDGSVAVFNTQVLGQTLDTQSGFAVVVSDNGDAKLSVTFVVQGITLISDYWVLSTDYDSYALVYSCTNLDAYDKSVAFWKMSRTKSLSATAVTTINNVMNTLDILDQRYFVNRDQSAEGCFYYPEPQPGIPVVFPGQCDNTIAAIPNFDLNQFQGTWYETAAYPKVEQPGQCINHQFTVGTAANTLGMQSSNVFNQILGLTSGNLVFGTTDGSGKFVLSFVSGGQTIQFPYWIISTDYTDYALAYSCVNIDADYRGVWSWKLSRTKQLSTAGNTNINNAIASIDVLDNVYFENIQQTDDACFYLPDVAPGEVVVFPGQCDASIPAMPNFDAGRYLGRWKLIETYPSNFQVGTCNEATYSLSPDGSVIVYNTEVVNQNLNSDTGIGIIASTDGSAKLSVTFPNNPVPVDYWVLDTDYESYTLIYTCININSEQRQVLSWKMSRDDTLSAAANSAIDQVVNSVNVLNQRYYETVDRSPSACFYFPTPDDSTPVVFRGQCDENIPVVSNFDAARYLGLWHDIESYPMPFQDGSCPNAFYSLNDDGSVAVFNTQVLGQTLDTQSGFAVVVSDNGDAKLDVTFVVQGITLVSSYWVLSTDYDSYALVYSCTNLNAEYKSVAFWKMSRTKSLSNTAVTTINNVMNTLDILDQRYFVNRDQSAEGCFYYPEPQPGVPVVFPGQCDNTIAAAPNFDLNQFQGTWYETAAYPKVEQPGQCINHQFTVGTAANTLGMQSSNVFNQELGLTSGNLVFGTTDGSGKFVLSFVSGGQTIQFPYWIISTDYTDYALAYSCVNIDADYRGVWSWKLSRTKQLSTAGNTIINNAIASIDVLDNVYFENIQQTDEACFYLPDLAPGEGVVFPGQCDASIPAMPNFDAGRYLGRWRLIETYPSDFQQGQCNEATYSLAADGSVIVYNTEVVNEVLMSDTGSAIVASTDGSGKLSVTFPNNPVAIDYWILDTDYDSYTLIYSCANINSEQRRVWSWKMSRTNTLSGDASVAINQVVDSINVLNSRYYQTVDRSDAACFYYPTPDGTSTVVFPGQCDENLSAVPNFNPVAYSGLWYDIESYPMDFQNGKCSKASYTLNEDNSVIVENTQVVDQLLETWIGSAVLASNDGSGILDVTFVVNGIAVTTNYWVLSTDYISYALVYTCRNINEETRAVFSWKLSRTPTLSATAITAIENTMNTIPVLDQQYYIERGHTEDDCFYYPDNNGGDVILEGQCVLDAEVPAVTNFNANSFTGTWHEVARFPSTLQNGECTSYQYTMAGSNNYNIEQTEVREERLQTVVTPATVSDDGRGVISVTISGVPFTDVYILATDYSEYALGYSCRNLENNRKQIYSWKFSRNQAGLSDAANAVIDQTVRENLDLHEFYYAYTGQDNAACFYYPEYEQLPAAIELRGPCNSSIRGIPNFNAGAYLGLWYETARYPQPSQYGQCSRAQYSSGDGVVDVFNNEVLNNKLEIQTGYAVVASNDGSGQLDVVFEVNGVILTRNYYILATDYISYSLVYSCFDLANGNRQVSSWKLSRSRTLSDEANNAMNSVIENTQGLIEEYYQSTSQSDEDCFYIPDMDPYSTPIFRGQCDESIGMVGFEPEKYLGWWHEIERYPVDVYPGECISSQYESRPGSASLNVVNTTVSNGVATITTLEVIPTDNGRLEFVGENKVIWVLATDYETYSLLYSCENVNDEYRSVWSAKYSRSRDLSENVQNALAPYIENNELLYPQFYINVDQSDTTCFHYPTIASGDDVIIPGRCDENIPVLQNFDVAEFAGTWYQIESYEDVGSKTCVGIKFEVQDGAEALDVISFDNLDAELNVIEAVATVISTDGSAKLNIATLAEDSEEVTSRNVYVLASDYQNYAMLYTCTNVNEFQRKVSATKISRERTLSAQSNAYLTQLIAQREELHQPYFKETPQNEDCLEPSSATLVQSSIIVLLVCAALQRLY